MKGKGKMEIEVVDFYPKQKLKNKKFVGTMHVYLCEKKIDIRGIKVFKAGKSFFVDVPHQYGYDDDEKKDVKYPLISFLENDEQEDFITSLRKEAKKYLHKKLKKKNKN